jgi:hypothetical protein
MARIARVVVPGLPHHVTRRGNRRMQTFSGEEDYRPYPSLVAEWCGRGWRGGRKTGRGPARRRTWRAGRTGWRSGRPAGGAHGASSCATATCTTSVNNQELIVRHRRRKLAVGRAMPCAWSLP